MSRKMTLTIEVLAGRIDETVFCCFKNPANPWSLVPQNLLGLRLIVFFPVGFLKHQRYMCFPWFEDVYPRQGGNILKHLPRLLSLSPRGISRIKRYPSRGANAECLRVCGPSWSTRVVCKSWKIEIMLDEGHGRAVLRYEDIAIDLYTLICCDVWSSSLSSHLQSGALGQPFSLNGLFFLLQDVAMVSLQFVERLLEFLASYFFFGVQKETDFNSGFNS